MSYLDVITLADAKNYLRVDEDFTADDDSIKLMIESALSYIESRTNHLFYAREKTYFKSEFENRISVYDYPINDDLSELNALYFSNRFEFQDKQITLDVGYQFPADVPSDLKMSAFKIIENWYFNYEKQSDKSIIPMAVKEIISQYQRFMVV